MKKLFSLLSVMFMFGMMFTSCSKSTDSNGNDPLEQPTNTNTNTNTKDQSFKTANALLKVAFSEDFLNLADVTVIYTNMEGKANEHKLDPEHNAVSINDLSSTLPANFTLQVKIAKSANYDAYLASKETVKLSFSLTPEYAVGWTDKSGEEHVLDYAGAESFMEGQEVPTENFGDDFEEFIKTVELTFTGSLEKNGDNVIFKYHLE